MAEHQERDARRKAELVDEDQRGEAEGERGKQQRRHEQEIAGANERVHGKLERAGILQLAGAGNSFARFEQALAAAAEQDRRAA